MIKSEDTDALGLLSENMNVDMTIDLNGLGAVEAIAKVEATLKFAKIEKIWFKFPLADGEGPTLFAPIGNHLREKLKAGKLIRLMPASKGGWIARLKN